MITSIVTRESSLLFGFQMTVDEPTDEKYVHKFDLMLKSGLPKIFPFEIIVSARVRNGIFFLSLTLPTPCKCYNNEVSKCMNGNEIHSHSSIEMHSIEICHSISLFHFAIFFFLSILSFFSSIYFVVHKHMMLYCVLFSFCSK